MADLSPEGHRKRMKERYIKGSSDTLDDHHLLELLLFYSIPRKDVKPVAYNILNHYKTLDKVFSAEYEDLLSIDSVGESTAMLIKLINDINKRIDTDKNKNIKRLSSYAEAKEYASNILRNLPTERIIVISLDNKLNIINTETIANGTVNFAGVDPKKIIKCVLRDNAASVIIAHNHPHGDPAPSPADVDFTADLLNILRNLNIPLNDHIIVGDREAISMSQMPRYAHFFD